MSIIQGTAKSGGTVAASFYDYPIEQSLRFDGSSYLSRTPTTAGNRKTWTWSGWVKRSNVGSSDNLVFQAGSGTPWFICGISANDSFIVSFNAGSSGANFNTDASFRDISAWYHIVFAVDTTQSTSTDRVKIYVNGTQASTIENSAVSLNYDTQVNNTQAHYTGRNKSSNSYFNGYLANIQLIDGQALDPYFFGESKNGVWIPYNAFSTAGSGTARASDGDTATDSYGTNGFHLTFEDGIESLPVDGYTGNQNAFRDKSHNTNHWKTN